MIGSKDELRFYLKADLMMNRGYFEYPVKLKIKEMISPDYVMRYLKALRMVEYYSNNRGGVKALYYKNQYKRYGLKLGFTIATNVLGYGVVIPHFGTIVVGTGNSIGNYAVLHTCICITAGNKKIGNGFYCATGAKVLNDVIVGDYVTVAANAVLNKSVNDNKLMVGIPATEKRSEPEWYSQNIYLERFEKCEEILELRKQ